MSNEPNPRRPHGKWPTLPRLRLRTKLLFTLLVVLSALITATLLSVRSYLRERARQEIYEGLRSSVITFQNFQHLRQLTLSRSAGLLANLPSLKALMTTRHEATIQDASTSFWRLAASDLFVLADRQGKIMALHTTTAGFAREAAQASLHRALSRGENRDWWYGKGHLYEVFIQPIYFGSPTDDSPLGVLALGYEIDSRVAEEVSRIASSQVAFLYDQAIVVSTLASSEQAELARHLSSLSDNSFFEPQDLQLGGERYLGSTVSVALGGNQQTKLTVLKSYDRATAFLENLNRLLLAAGLAAILAGSGLIFLASHTFTRPLAKLVAGVRALEKGDFGYPLDPHSNDEVGELTSAFDRMRKSLRRSQEDLLQAERLATIGRMASSISHDLRHPLTAILAYAEFLAEGNLDDAQRKGLYEEIRQAVSRMTDLIGSLLEFSKAQEALRPGYGSVVETLERAVQTVRIRPEFRSVTVASSHNGLIEGWFDFKKLERVFHNLVLNACEAVSPDSGRVEVSARQTHDSVELRISDNGLGIPESIRERVFQPFVSFGKENGTGLGLAVAQKIIQDHGGRIQVESSTEHGTVFKITLPLVNPSVRAFKL